MPVRVSPGPPSSPAGRRRTEELQRIQQQELDLVRAQAEKWRNGLAGLLGLITVVNIVKGPDMLDKVAAESRLVIAITQIGALAVATAGAYFAMRAAFGMPRRRKLTGGLHELLGYRSATLSRVVTDLRLAIVATITTLALLGTAMGVAWTATEAGQYVKVTDGSVTRCGTFVSAKSGVLTVHDKSDIKVPLTGTVTFEIVDRCDKG